ncbi:MAG: glycosyltransferase [Flavisolibacter sp.]
MQNKITVLECIRQGQIGGGESHLLSLVENLDRSRFNPVVLSFTDGPMINRLNEMQVETHIIPTVKPFDVTVWRSVKKLLAKKNIDLIHAHGTRANSNVLWAARSLGIPVIYTVHGWSFHPDQRYLTRRIRILGEKYLTSKSSLNISVSSSNQQTGKEAIPGFDSVVINNGIDHQKFNPNRELKDIRAELGIPKDAVLTLFIARFTGHKQPLTLIRSFEKALPANPDLFLLMVGDGDQKAEALSLVDELGIGHRVKFESFRQDVPDVLAAADLFILPSLWEGLPIGLLEAMSMGKAIIASEVDGTREIINHGINGLLVKTADLEADLALTIGALSLDGEQRKKLATEARKTVIQKYDAGEMTRKIEALYLEEKSKNRRGR